MVLTDYSMNERVDRYWLFVELQEPFFSLEFVFIMRCGIKELILLDFSGFAHEQQN